MHARARALWVKNAQPREAPTGRAGALLHRIASSRRRVSPSRREGDVDARAIVRSIRRPRFGTSRRDVDRRPSSPARARARRRRSVVRVSRGRSRRHESNRIEFESNL